MKIYMNTIEDIKAFKGEVVDATQFYKQYELNLDKINSVDDCKKILKFLCDLVIRPLSDDVEYNGFNKIKEYFF